MGDLKGILTKEVASVKSMLNTIKSMTGSKNIISSFKYIKISKSEFSYIIAGIIIRYRQNQSTDKIYITRTQL